VDRYSQNSRVVRVSCRLMTMLLDCRVPLRNSGRVVWNDEKPRSKVMPRAWLCGLLSNAAVDAVVLRARAAQMIQEIRLQI